MLNLHRDKRSLGVNRERWEDLRDHRQYGNGAHRLEVR